MSAARSSGETINPRWETLETDCDVCGSLLDGDYSRPETCLRVRMDHCAAFYGCVCLPCAEAIAAAFEEYDEG